MAETRVFESVERFMFAIGEVHDGLYSVDDQTGLLKTESGFVMESGWVAYVERYHKDVSTVSATEPVVTSLPDATACSIIAAGLTNCLNPHSTVAEDRRDAALWTIAGHIARLSHAFGRDPDPPKDPTQPF